jgi:hypothetical protein
MNEIGVPFYDRRAWRELKTIPEAKIDGTYAEYLRRHERMKAAFAARGVEAIDLPVNISEVVRWCRKHGYEPDSHGRATYGSCLMAARANGEDVMDFEVVDRSRGLQ